VLFKVTPFKKKAFLAYQLTTST